MAKNRFLAKFTILISSAWCLSVLLHFRIFQVEQNSATLTPDIPKIDPLPTHHDASIRSNGQPPSILNPFLDIKLSPSPGNTRKPPPYSSFQCVQADQTGFPDFMARTCKYHNIYYKPSEQSFHYYTRPYEISEYHNATYLAEAMTVADGFLRWDKLSFDGLENVSTTGTRFTYDWKPTIETHFSSVNYSTIVSPSNPVFTLYLPSYSFNLGHLVFDDLLSIFSMLHFFGYALDTDSQPIPFFVERPNEELGINFGSRDPFWRCHPDHAARWSKCVQLWSRVYPSLLGVTPDPKTGDIMRTGNWMRGSAAIGEYDIKTSSTLDIQKLNDSNSLQFGDYVLLPTVVYGPGRLANWACKGECSIGRGLWLWEFRRYLIGNVLGQYSALHEPRNQGLITFSLPVGTTHADKVTHFEDVVEEARKVFGSQRVKVVDMATLTMKEQVELVRVSAVYITNHGGGSASAVFLPRGATLIIYHGIGRKGEPKMLDRHFWNSLGYARVLWVPPNHHRNVVKGINLIQYGLDTFAL